MKTNFFTLNRERDFRKAYSKGKSLVSFCIVVYLNKNFNKGTRIGITASKKVGNAVQRNRARRVIKSAFFEFSKGKNFGNVDVVMVARGQTTKVKSYVIKKQLDKLFLNSGI